jgi:hypothetical protein
MQVKVVNAGADSALTESLPQRLHAALRRHPEAHALVLLLGTNDILARLHPLPHHLLKLQASPRNLHVRLCHHCCSHEEQQAPRS